MLQRIQRHRLGIHQAVESHQDRIAMLTERAGSARLAFLVGFRNSAKGWQSPRFRYPGPDSPFHASLLFQISALSRSSLFRNHHQTPHSHRVCLIGYKPDLDAACALQIDHFRTLTSSLLLTRRTLDTAETIGLTLRCAFVFLLRRARHAAYRYGEDRQTSAPFHTHHRGACLRTASHPVARIRVLDTGRHCGSRMYPHSFHELARSCYHGHCLDLGPD